MCAGYEFGVMRHTVKSELVPPTRGGRSKMGGTISNCREKRQTPTAKRVNQCKTKSECRYLSFATEKISTTLSELSLLTKSSLKERFRAGRCSLKTQFKGLLTKAKAFALLTSIMQPLLIGLSLGTFNPHNKAGLLIVLSFSAKRGTEQDGILKLLVLHCYQKGRGADYAG